MKAEDATWDYSWTLHTAPDLNRWLQGFQPGEFAASQLNPVIL